MIVTESPQTSEQKELVHASRQYKIDRIRRGFPPRVLDLFAGCGGLSLGFKTVGFEISGAVEIDSDAIRSHAINFHKNYSEAEIRAHSQPIDITITEPENLAAMFAFNEEIHRSIDVIVGGPPCQAFARVGRAKLREVAAHPEAFLQDARGNLYLRYLHYVVSFQPLILLMENVPDVLNYGGHNIANEMSEYLTDLGYTCHYTLLNAAYFGVPQMRERMFLIATANEVNKDFQFPQPTHWVDLPPGYEGSRQVALKSLTPTLFSQLSPAFFVARPTPVPTMRPAISVREALSDLPVITEHLRGLSKKGARRFDERLPYPKNENLSEYANIMRNWVGFENHIGVADHVIRSLPRDYSIFRRMNHGDQYPEAYEHALDLFNERLQELEKEGINPEPNSREFDVLKKKMIPPYDTGKFPNKWRKMEPDLPARTLMAHLGKDSYSHIHYDSNQARTISVREAARLQSFPDGFIFSGTMNPAFKQIGNAVPPLLALALAKVISAVLHGGK